MDLGSTFVRLYDGEWLDCTVTWTGRMPLIPVAGPYTADLPMAPQSSLHGVQETLRTGTTASGMGHRRTSSRSFSQTALRA